MMTSTMIFFCAPQIFFINKVNLFPADDSAVTRHIESTGG